MHVPLLHTRCLQKNRKILKNYDFKMKIGIQKFTSRLVSHPGEYISSVINIQGPVTCPEIINEKECS